MARSASALLGALDSKPMDPRPTKKSSLTLRKVRLAITDFLCNLGVTCPHKIVPILGCGPILSESNKFTNHYNRCHYLTHLQNREWLSQRTWAPGLPPSSVQRLRASCRLSIVRSGPVRGARFAPCQVQMGVGGSSKVIGLQPAPWVDMKMASDYHEPRAHGGPARVTGMFLDTGC